MAQSKSKKWMAFIVLTIAAGLIYRVPYLKTVFYDPLVAAFQITNTEVGTMMSVYSVVKTVLYIPAGILVDRFDNRKMLVFSMLFGVIHLFLGLGMKGYMLLKDKKYLDFVCDVVFWYLLLIGLILILLPSGMFESISQMQFNFPPILNQAAKLMAVAGAAGILLMSGRGRKNWFLRVALGAYDLYGVTSWLSDVLSYSRLLALGLATGVIGSVINSMGAMLGGGVVGAIGFTLVFLIGHSVNIGINLLGAYVHTNRLQYVEFFGKFYEGGGRPFNPFSIHTNYVEFKEEN